MFFFAPPKLKRLVLLRRLSLIRQKQALRQRVCDMKTVWDMSLLGLDHLQVIMPHQQKESKEVEWRQVAAQRRRSKNQRQSLKTLTNREKSQKSRQPQVWQHLPVRHSLRHRVCASGTVWCLSMVGNDLDRRSASQSSQKLQRRRCFSEYVT